jgi:hypothetical protein
MDFCTIEGLYTTRFLRSHTLETKVDIVVILSTAAATLLVIVFGTAGLATIFAQQIFTANLSGSNEVPPVTSVTSGIATFQLLPVGHQLVMNYQLSLKNITGVTAALIHNGKQGENGPTVASLFNASKPTGPINGLLTAGTLTSSKLTGPLQGKLSLSPLVDMIRSGEAYVNVHTTLDHAGKVRGQIS